MNRFRRDTTLSKSLNGDDDDEKSNERQALIDDDVQICDQDTSPFMGPINRRHRTKNSLELKSIQKTRDLICEPNIEFTYYDIQPGDTLQSVSLRYACPVNQVKRLNGLMTDQEFYGLRRLKLPLGKLGLLEDVLRTQNNNSLSDLIQMHDEENVESQVDSPRKFVNSPGSALSIATFDVRHSPRFKPLLSPGHSSDNINRLSDGSARHNYESRLNGINIGHLQHNSHSFSSLREFDHENHENVSIDFGNVNNQHLSPDRKTSRRGNNELRAKTFIKSAINPSMEDAQVTIDALLNDIEPEKPNIFEDLDYHIEQAKAVAETYDKRAAELTDRIDINRDNSVTITRGQAMRISKIPELFFSGENFGLNLTKLIALIFFICLVVPLVYMNQVNVIKKQL